MSSASSLWMWSGTDHGNLHCCRRPLHHQASPLPPPPCHHQQQHRLQIHAQTIIVREMWHEVCKLQPPQCRLACVVLAALVVHWQSLALTRIPRPSPLPQTPVFPGHGLLIEGVPVVPGTAHVECRADSTKLQPQMNQGPHIF